MPTKTDFEHPEKERKEKKEEKKQKQKTSDRKRKILRDNRNKNSCRK